MSRARWSLLVLVALMAGGLASGARFTPGVLSTGAESSSSLSEPPALRFTEADER